MGHDPVGRGSAVYIGEADVVLERLAGHLDHEDFWSEAVVFTDQHDLLSPAHVKYLQSILIGRANEAGRYVVLNSAAPQESALTRADHDAIEDYADNLQVLLAMVFGLHPIIIDTRLQARA